MTHFGLTGVYFVSVHSGEALCLHFFFEHGVEKAGVVTCLSSKSEAAHTAHLISYMKAARLTVSVAVELLSKKVNDFQR